MQCLPLLSRSSFSTTIFHWIDPNLDGQTVECSFDVYDLPSNFGTTTSSPFRLLTAAPPGRARRPTRRRTSVFHRKPSVRRMYRNTGRPRTNTNPPPLTSRTPHLWLDSKEHRMTRVRHKYIHRGSRAPPSRPERSPVKTSESLGFTRGLPHLVSPGGPSWVDLDLR